MLAEMMSALRQSYCFQGQEPTILLQTLLPAYTIYNWNAMKHMMLAYHRHGCSVVENTVSECRHEQTHSGLCAYQGATAMPPPVQHRNVDGSMKGGNQGMYNWHLYVA